MKKIELRKIPCGNAFEVFGEKFVVLDHSADGVLSIRNDNWKDAPFDRDAKNDLREASVLGVLKDYEWILRSNGADDDDLLPLHIDLKATDGTRTYGYIERTVGILTLEQYGKYKDIIPFASKWWWLASPWTTRWLRTHIIRPTHYTWFVHSNGDYNSNDCSCHGGVRPVLNFAPLRLVSPVDLDNGRKDDKEKAWEAYHEYLSCWMEDDTFSGGHYGDSPLSFVEWMEDLYEPECDEE